MAQIPQFVQPNTGGAIRSIGQTVGNLITSIPGLKQKGDEIDRQEELYAQAVKAAGEDWTAMTSAYKGIKQDLTERLKPLVEQGVITEQEKNTHLKSFRMPTHADQKDSKAYMIELGDALKNINQEIGTKVGQQKASSYVQSSTGAGTPAQEAVAAKPFIPGGPPIPAQGPEPGTQPGLRQAEAIPGQPGQLPTQAQPAVPAIEGGKTIQEDVLAGASPDIAPFVQKDPRYLSMQSRKEQYGRETDIKKQAMAKRKQDEVERHNKAMEKRGFGDNIRKESTKKFEILLDAREDTSKKEIQLTDKKRQAVSLLSRLRKPEPLSASELLDIEEMGVNPQVAATSSNEELAVDVKNIIKEFDVLIKRQSKISKDIENTIVEIADNPQVDLPSALIEAQKTVYPDQPERALAPPPALGGPAQIGKGVQSPGTTKTITTTPKVTAVSVNRDRTAVKLSDGTTIAWDEAKQRGLIK